jgi:hypothetical protein
MNSLYFDEFFYDIKKSKEVSEWHDGIESKVFYSFNGGVKLKKDFYSVFPKGTKFDYFELNLCQVIYMNIYDRSVKHLFERCGYNYIGRWSIELICDDGEVVYYDDLCWCDFGMFNTTKYTETKRTKKGFKLTELVFTKNVPEEKLAKKIATKFYINFVDHKISFICDGTLYEYKFRLKIRLLPESVPTSYLEKAFNQKLIRKSDYDDQKSRREMYNFDVQIPSFEFKK